MDYQNDWAWAILSWGYIFSFFLTTGIMAFGIYNIPFVKKWFERISE